METFPGIPFWPLRLPPWPASKSFRHRLALIAALRRGKPALIEVHNRPGLALALARHCPDTPVTLLLHNDPREMAASATPAQRARLSRDLAGVATVSAFLRDVYQQGAGADAVPPDILPNCLDLASLPPLSPPGQREKLILFAGRLVPEKGAARFVAACRAVLPHLPGWRAEMIGGSRLRPGPDSDYAVVMRAEAEAAGIGVTGYQPHAAVLSAMARAAILVVPSLWEEPFGLVALEGMACGAAVLSSPRGGLPEVTGDAACLADPGDEDGFAAALMALARDEAARSSLSEAGRRRAIQFDAPRAAVRLDDFRLAAIDRWRMRAGR